MKLVQLVKRKNGKTDFQCKQYNNNQQDESNIGFHATLTSIISICRRVNSRMSEKIDFFSQSSGFHSTKLYF